MRIGPKLPALLACGLSAALAWLAPNAFAGTARRDPPLLFGAGPHQVRAPVVVDPALPTGRGWAAQLERPHSAGAACSARVPVCVQRGSAVSGADALSALSALELAYERVVQALGLPAPLGDDGHGGSDALAWDRDAEHSQLVTEHDAPRLGGFDRAAAFCVSAGGADAALLERDATLCVGEAIAKRLAPGATAAIQRAFAIELWWLTGRVTALDVQAIDDAQGHPERALAARGAEPNAAASLLFDFLERARSSQGSGGLVTSLLSAAASTTPSGAFEWNDEPDVFDVLRHSLDENTGKMATLLGQYAVSRAFLGDRDDGTHPPYSEWAGAFGRANYDWVILVLSRRCRAACALRGRSSRRASK